MTRYPSDCGFNYFLKGNGWGDSRVGNGEGDSMTTFRVVDVRETTYFSEVYRAYEDDVLNG